MASLPSEFELQPLDTPPRPGRCQSVRCPRGQRRRTVAAASRTRPCTWPPRLPGGAHSAAHRRDSHAVLVPALPGPDRTLHSVSPPARGAHPKWAGPGKRPREGCPPDHQRAAAAPSKRVGCDLPCARVCL